MGWRTALRDPHIGAALAALHADYGRPWTVEALAAVASMSRSSFAATFTRLVGDPPLRYLTAWRMHTAARLLRTTDSSLAAIAAQVGYLSEAAFSRVFARELGTAPGAYRKQHRGRATT